MSITDSGSDDKDPEQIQQEIEETRSGMSSKINALNRSSRRDRSRPICSTWRGTGSSAQEMEQIKSWI